MNNTHKDRAELISIKKLKHSRNGNPRYKVQLETLDGYIITGITETDSAFVYGIAADSALYSLFNVEYRVLSNRNVISNMELVR